MNTWRPALARQHEGQFDIPEILLGAGFVRTAPRSSNIFLIVGAFIQIQGFFFPSVFLLMPKAL